MRRICPKCGHPRQRMWKRCDSCARISNKYRRESPRADVQVRKARALAYRAVMREQQRTWMAEATSKMLREQNEDLRQWKGAVERELGRTLKDWVGFPPAINKVRMVPPQFRIPAPYMASMADGRSPIQDTVSLDIRDLYPLYILLRDEHVLYPMHRMLEVGHDSPDRPRYAYMMDESAPFDGRYAMIYIVDRVVHELQRDREGKRR